MTSTADASAGVRWKGVTEKVQFEVRGGHTFMHRRIVLSSFVRSGGSEMAATGGACYRPAACGQDCLQGVLWEKSFFEDNGRGDLMMVPLKKDGVKVLEDKVTRYKAPTDSGESVAKKFYNNLPGKVTYQCEDGSYSQWAAPHSENADTYLIDVYRYGFREDNSYVKVEADAGDLDMKEGDTGCVSLGDVLCDEQVRITTDLTLYWY